MVIVPVRLVVGRFVASARSNAGVASVPPRVSVTPPTEVVGSANLLLAIEPANWVLVIVPVRLVVGRFVASCRSNAGVESAPPRDTLTPPRDTLELASLPLAIEPANLSFEMLPAN